MTTVWDQANANTFIDAICERIEAAGFQRPDIIGSVKRNGHSTNDLDLLLRPISDRTMTLEAAIEFIEGSLLPTLSDQKVVNPLECFDHEHVWFMGIELRPDEDGDQRVVEFYLSEADFPLELDESPSRPRDR